MSSPPKDTQIREVWAHNLDAEFALIRNIVDSHPFVAMDTEFPGTVARPVGSFPSNSDHNYAKLRDNVEMLKLIQLGLTFCDPAGNLPRVAGAPCVWQFNFREFDPRRDAFASDSVDLLRQSGFDFDRFGAEGVDSARFGELLMSSGVVLNDSACWATFHSGFDFGYLLKLLTCRALPSTLVGFLELTKIYFPTFYDLKHLMKFRNSLHGGLNKLAELLGVERVGTCHQAGSDSLVTAFCYLTLKERHFGGDTERYVGVLYSLEVESGQLSH